MMALSTCERFLPTPLWTCLGWSLPILQRLCRHFEFKTFFPFYVCLQSQWQASKTRAFICKPLLSSKSLNELEEKTFFRLGHRLCFRLAGSSSDQHEHVQKNTCWTLAQKKRRTNQTIHGLMLTIHFRFSVFRLVRFQTSGFFSSPPFSTLQTVSTVLCAVAQLRSTSINLMSFFMSSGHEQERKG